MKQTQEADTISDHKIGDNDTWTIARAFTRGDDVWHRRPLVSFIDKKVTL